MPRELPFLDLSLANRNTIKGHGTFLALVEHVNGRAEDVRCGGMLEILWPIA